MTSPAGIQQVLLAQHVQNRNFQPQTASLTAFLISIKCHFILPVAQVQIFMSALAPLCVSSPISNLTPIPTFHTWAKLPCLSHHPSLLGGNAAIASHIVSLFHLAHLQSLPNRMWSWKRQVISPHLPAPSLPMIPTSLEEKSKSSQSHEAPLTALQSFWDLSYQHFSFSFLFTC